MSRLIVLSNRVKMPDNDPMAGGLAVALQDILLENSGIWMGWNGEIVDPLNHQDEELNNDAFSSSVKVDLARANVEKSNSEINFITTALTTQQYQHFYCGFANNVLWPLLHEQLNYISEAPKDYSGYQAVNLLFARQLKKVSHPDDVIWVHDYHFLSVAYYCRQLGMKNRIGFFLHIPFAPLTFWKQLDNSAELIKHLAHYDVLGTQTQHDRSNCLEVIDHYLQDFVLEDSRYIESDNDSQSDSQIESRKIDFNNNPLENNSTESIEELLATKRDTEIKFTSRSSVNIKLNFGLDVVHKLAINAYPIGVNVAKIQQQVSSLSLQAEKRNPSLKAVNTTSQKMIAVDRIDYSKGLLERFSAYRTFLQRNPVYQNNLEFLQIACPSRLDLPAYQQLCDSVRHSVSSVNQQLSYTEDSKATSDNVDVNINVNTDASVEADVDCSDNNTDINKWQAITYSEKVLDHETLMTAFWHSDIGWVNSLKDGMNLVAKEYIAAQNPANPGVLLLSRYAGAAEQMQAAVIIDPNDPESVIEGLKTALEMPLAQRKLRYDSLLLGLKQQNLHDWQKHFLDDLYLN